jgi:Flp pilus assembly protein TadD
VSQAAKERAENKAQLEATKARKAQAAFENGLAHFRQKQIEATIDQFSLALSLKPGDTTSLQQRAAAFLEVGDSWQALVDYCQLIECEPKKAGYYFTRSQLYAKLGHPQAARKDLAYANRLKPLPQELGKPAQG